MAELQQKDGIRAGRRTAPPEIFAVQASGSH